MPGIAPEESETPQHSNLLPLEILLGCWMHQTFFATILYCTCQSHKKEVLIFIQIINHTLNVLLKIMVVWCFWTILYFLMPLIIHFPQSCQLTISQINSTIPFSPLRFHQSLLAVGWIQLYLEPSTGVHFF